MSKKKIIFFQGFQFPPQKSSIQILFFFLFLGIFTEPEHLIGHEAFLDVTQLTDEQLGIPPIDE